MRKYDKVDQSMTKHLTTQGRPIPKGGLHFSSVKKKTWTPLIGTFDTLTTVKNILEMRKLWPPKIKGVKN